jgi:uncharacterized protein (DUF488 family)
MPAIRVLTIGHSSLSAEAFLARLQAHRIEAIVDVRRRPGSRRHPHFARAALEQSLSQAGMLYRHEPDLGGMREGVEGSPNDGIEDPVLRAYADHMSTRAFGGAVKRVLGLAAARRTALMCAEADPGRCHRNLLADELLLCGAEVLHVIDGQRLEPHALHPLARAAPDGGVLYRAGRVHQGELF